MDKLDPRWANVHATFGPVPIRGVDIETGRYKELEKFQELRFVVPYNGINYHAAMQIHNDDLDDSLFQFVADHLVFIIDDELKHHNA